MSVVSEGAAVFGVMEAALGGVGDSVQRPGGSTGLVEVHLGGYVVSVVVDRLPVLRCAAQRMRARIHQSRWYLARVLVSSCEFEQFRLVGQVVSNCLN